MDVSGVPPVERLRWPILVALDTLGEDEILDLEGRVAEHLDMSDDARSFTLPDAARPLLVQRMMQAVEDLYQAGAVEPDVEADVIRITDVGRRLTETDVVAMPVIISSGDGDPEPPDGVVSAPEPEKPSIGDWVGAFFDGLF